MSPTNRLSTIRVFAMLCLLGACGPTKDPLLAEAAQLQQQAAAIHDEVMVQLEDAERLAQKLRVKREITDSTARTAIDSTLARLDDSGKAMSEWMDGAATADGAAQHHAEGENHDHAVHGTQPDLTPQQLRDVRLELKQRMEKLQDDLTQQMKTAKKLL